MYGEKRKHDFKVSKCCIYMYVDFFIYYVKKETIYRFDIKYFMNIFLKRLNLFD